MCQRLFLIGVVVFLLGVQLRLVKSFELNELASQAVAKRLGKPAATTTTSFVAYDPVTNDPWGLPQNPPAATTHTVTPPPWLGWSLISVGSVLVLTCPCFRN